jgi:hypothetical protein
MKITEIANRKLFLDNDIIFSKIDPLLIFKYYIKDDFILGRPFSSPLRTDNIPSFSIYRNKNGEILYNDFVAGGGNCIRFVKELFGYNTYYEAKSKIAVDFGFYEKYIISSKITVDDKEEKDRDIITSKQKKVEERKGIIKLDVKIRTWEHKDINYWKTYGISIKTLKEYDVHPISYVFIRNNIKEFIIRADSLAYVFIERKDGNVTKKIYQPFSKNYKWINNHDFSVWQGWCKLSDSGDILIITKSLKDVMSIKENIGYDAVSLQQENAKAKEQVVNELKSRFGKIYVLYDNDFDKEINWGEKFGTEFTKIHDLININIPLEYMSKDFSDLIKNIGCKKACEVLKNLITKK